MNLHSKVKFNYTLPEYVFSLMKILLRSFIFCISRTFCTQTASPATSVWADEQVELQLVATIMAGERWRAVGGFMVCVCVCMMKDTMAPRIPPMPPRYREVFK